MTVTSYHDSYQLPVRRYSNRLGDRYVPKPYSYDFGYCERDEKKRQEFLESISNLEPDLRKLSMRMNLEWIAEMTIQMAITSVTNDEARTNSCS